jgi:hypothetical protein
MVMSKRHPDLRILKRVRITSWNNPLKSWEDLLDDTEIHAYRMAGYVVAEVD